MCHQKLDLALLDLLLHLPILLGIVTNSAWCILIRSILPSSSRSKLFVNLHIPAGGQLENPLVKVVIVCNKSSAKGYFHLFPLPALFSRTVSVWMNGFSHITTKHSCISPLEWHLAPITLLTPAYADSIGMHKNINKQKDPFSFITHSFFHSTTYYKHYYLPPLSYLYSYLPNHCIRYTIPTWVSYRSLLNCSRGSARLLNTHLLHPFLRLPALPLPLPILTQSLVPLFLILFFL